MRRYLDNDLEAKKITKKNMEGIRKRIYKKYKIDLRRLLDNKELDGSKIDAMVAEKCLGETVDKIDMNWEKIQYQNIDAQGLVLPMRNIVHMDYRADDSCGDESASMNSGKSYMDLLEKLTKKEPIDIENEYRKITFEEWMIMMDFMIRQSGIFKADYEIQCLFRLKYSLNSLNEIEYDSYEQEEPSVKKMVAGRLSKWEYYPMKRRNIPFFIGKLQDLLFSHQRYFRIFDFEIFGNENKIIKEKDYKGNIDITRYSYKYIEEIYEKICGSELENYYYLDDMLGVSLTNTIFNYIVYGHYPGYEDNETAGEKVKAISINPNIFTDELFAVIKQISSLECVYGRNHLAQFIFSFLCDRGFDKRSVNDIGKYLEEKTKQINILYNDLCDIRIWIWLYDIEEFSDDEKEQTVTELEEMYEEKVKEIIRDKNIASIVLPQNNENKYTLKKMKVVRKPENAYAQIHMAVMEGIWERSNEEKK